MKLSDLRKRLDDLASKKKLSAKECALLLDAVCFLDFIDAFETTENAVQFAAADREGRVVVFPFSPKKNFYYIHDGVVCEARVAYFEVGCAAIFLYAVGEKKPFFVSYIDSNSRKIEQTVFATPEEAAAALAEKGE